jgi:lysophospholipase L1-like esterase
MEAAPPTIGSPSPALKLFAAAGLALALAVVLAWHDWLPGGYRLRTQFESDTARSLRATQLHAFQRLEEFAETNPTAPRGATLFLGSSTIERFPLEECFPGKPCLNRGVDNADLGILLAVLTEMLPRQKLRAAVIYAGSPDLQAGKPVEEILLEMRQLVQRLRFSAGLHLPITLIGVLPARETTPERTERLRALDRGLMELTRDLNLAYVPTLRPPLVDSQVRLNTAICVDDRHLSPAGYSILARWLIEEGGEAGRGLVP